MTFSIPLVMLINPLSAASLVQQSVKNDLDHANLFDIVVRRYISCLGYMA